MRILESVTRWLGTPDYDSWGPQDPARGNQSGAAATTCLNWRRFRPTSYRRSCPKRLIAGWISLLSSRDKMRKSAMRPAGRHSPRAPRQPGRHHSRFPGMPGGNGGARCSPFLQTMESRRSAFLRGRRVGVNQGLELLDLIWLSWEFPMIASPH